MFRSTFTLLCLISLPLAAQPPGIAQNGVFNAASRVSPSLPGGSLARGARFTVVGVRLAGSAGAEVTLTQGKIIIAAKVLDAEPNRIEGIVPENAPLGQCQLQVRRGSDFSAAFRVTILSANTGLYSQNGNGWGPGRIRNLGPSGGDNSILHAAQPLERIAIAVTGASKETPPEIFVGGQLAKAVSIRTSNRAGDEEIVAEIPSSAPEGCFVPVYAQDRNLAPSNFVTVSIKRGGGPCRVAPDFPIPLVTERKTGLMTLSRVSGLSQNGRENWVDDDGLAVFIEKGPGPAISPLSLAPPAGTCTFYTGSSESLQLPNSISDGLFAQIGGRGLDYGPEVTVRNGNDSRSIPRTPGAPGYYRSPLGSSTSKRRPLFLEPELSYSIKIAPGAEGRPFEFTSPGTHAFTWTNRGTVNEIDRKRPLTLNWNPARPDQVMVILAIAVDQSEAASAMCYCLARGNEGKFTIPAGLLANFPVSTEVPPTPSDQVIVAALPLHNPHYANVLGLDELRLISIYANLKVVTYR